MPQSMRMIAILGGLGAALAWTVAVLASARASREIGSTSTVAWATLMGLLVALPFVVASGPVPPMAASTVAWFIASGFAGIAGFLLAYRGFGMGKIGIVSAVASTEGAVGALIAIAAGERLTVAAGVTLALIAGGVATVALSSHAEPQSATSRRHVDPAAAPRALALGGLAAVAFGIGLFGTAQVGGALPVVYGVLPARIVGTFALFVPMLLLGRLRMTREAFPFVALVAVVEVLGTASYVLGARQSVAVAAVLASQFAALASVAAFVLYREHLTLRQRSGVAAIAIGVAALAALRA